MSAISVTYGKKVPGAQEYSSESVTVTLTQDLGDEHVEDNELRQAIDAIYQLVKQEVDSRLQTRPQAAAAMLPPANGAPHFPRTNGNGFNGNRFNGPRQASPKQVSYLTTLANKRGLSFQDLAGFLQQTTGKTDPYQLTSAEAARVIDSLKV